MLKLETELKSKSLIDLNKIPGNSGAYIFKDIDGKVLYVGKAKNLRKRVSSYFQKNHIDLKTELLVKKVYSIEWIITNNEIEALILENNLIKKYRPPFNIKLADDKTYPYIKINLNEDYPKIEITRRKDDENSLYFGPYTSAFALKQTINFLQKNFKLRKCTDRKFKNRIRPCLNYQINLCSAPCCGYVSKEEYRTIFEQALLFLKGKTDELIKILKEKMNKYSENLEFEKAAEMRDIIFNIEKFVENQNQSVEINEFIDTDVFTYRFYNGCYYFYVMKLKNGKIIGSDFYKFEDVSFFDEKPLENFIPKYYLAKESVPEKIIIPEKGYKTFLRNFFIKKFSKHVEIEISSSKLIKLSYDNLNARIEFEIEKRGDLEKIKKLLNLKNFPRRIDAFDISTFRGKESVGARIVYKDGDFAKNYYRRYKIKSIEQGMNDFAMIYEIVFRSCKEYLENNEFPDLILIDGGKGQLNLAYKALKEKSLSSKIDIISIAKDDSAEFDKIYLVNRKNPANLSRHPGIIKFFMKIRDEAHRFAVKYHHKRDEIEKFKTNG